MSDFTERMLTNPQLWQLWPRDTAAARRRTPAMARLRTVLRRWHQRMRERQALARLSDHELRDILLTRVDVQNELAKPFWRD